MGFCRVTSSVLFHWAFLFSLHITIFACRTSAQRHQPPPPPPKSRATLSLVPLNTGSSRSFQAPSPCAVTSVAPSDLHTLSCTLRYILNTPTRAQLCSTVPPRNRQIQSSTLAFTALGIDQSSHDETGLRRLWARVFPAHNPGTATRRVRLRGARGCIVLPQPATMTTMRGHSEVKVSSSRRHPRDATVTRTAAGARSGKRRHSRQSQRVSGPRHDDRSRLRAPRRCRRVRPDARPAGVPA